MSICDIWAIAAASRGVANRMLELAIIELSSIYFARRFTASLSAL